MTEPDTQPIHKTDPEDRAMPPTQKPPAGKTEWKMPHAPAVVVWRNADGGEESYAVVTKYNKHSVSLMVFPPESRIGVPKDGVRFHGDPWNRTNGINADSGVWDYTNETREFESVKLTVAELAVALSLASPKK